MDAVMPELLPPSNGPQDLRSPNWANTWVGRTAWALRNVGRVALLARRGMGHEFLVEVANEAAELRALYPDLFREDRQRMMRLAHLTLDDDPDKVYTYVPEPTDVVYYAVCEADGVIKIGTSKWAGRRVADGLSIEFGGAWRLLAIEPGDAYVESYRHRQFAEHWIAPERQGESREFFAPGASLLEHINTLLANPTEWLPRENIDHLATRYVFAKSLDLPEFTGRPSTTVEDVVARQQYILHKAAFNCAEHRRRVHRHGHYT